MATSGSFTDWSGNLYIKIEWSRTSVNVNENYSVISVTVSVGGTYQVSSSATKNGSVTVNGNTSGLSFTIGTQGNNWSKVISTSSMMIPHNSDGTKTFSLSAWADVNISLTSGYVGRLSVSGSSTLDTIPRASSFASLTPSLDAGSSLSWTITPAASGLVHDIWVNFTTSVGTRSHTISSAANTGSWTLPLAWIDVIPSSVTGTVKVYLRTKTSSGTQIGERIYNVTVRVPASVVPTITAVTFAESGGTVPSAWGVFVQNKSYITANGSSQGAYGSTIVSRSMTFGTTTRSYWNTQFAMPNAGTFKFVAKVTDSRGRTATANSASFVVHPYSAPSITSALFSRVNYDGSSNEEGTTGTSTVKWSLSSVAGKNTLQSTSLRYAPKGTTSWTTVSGGLGASGVTKLFANGALSQSTAYIIEAKVTDQFTTRTYLGQISSVFVTMDFMPGGAGVAFGKMSTLSGAVEFNMKILASQGFISKKIPANADLHSTEYQQVGWYYCPANADVATMSGSPPDNQAGALEVHTAAGTVQFWHNYGNNGRSWRRSLYLGSWSTWEIVHDPTDGIYKAFVPTWTQSTGGALSIGNGSMTCRWTRVGNQVTANYSVIRGSTTNQGISPYIFTLPINGQAYTEVHGNGWIYKSSGGTYTPINVVGVGSGAIGLMLASNGARLSNTVPSAWGTNDQIRWQVVYETHINKY